MQAALDAEEEVGHSAAEVAAPEVGLARSEQGALQVGHGTEAAEPARKMGSLETSQAVEAVGHEAEAMELEAAELGYNKNHGEQGADQAGHEAQAAEVATQKVALAKTHGEETVGHKADAADAIMGLSTEEHGSAAFKVASEEQTAAAVTEEVAPALPEKDMKNNLCKCNAEGVSTPKA